MPRPSRTMHLPAPGDVRTCTRWACLQRIPGSGPDPAALSHHVEWVVHAVAATLIVEAEVNGALQATDRYVDAFLDQYWTGIPALPGHGYPKALLAAAEERGAVCIETLVDRVLPRLQYTERLLAHTQPFGWTIPDGTDGELVIPGVIARLGEDRLTGILRIYDWRIEEDALLHGTSVLRYQQIGVALGWLQAQYPGRQTAYVEVFLLTDVAWGSTRTPEELRLLEDLLRHQAAQRAAEERTPWQFGPPPLHLGRN